MQIKSLEYLVALEQCGSINKAATNSFISQQGLSKVLDSMEAELGYKLLIRKRNGIEFTNAGISFLSHAKKIIAEYEQAQNELKAIATPAQSVEINAVISPYVTMNLFKKLSKRNSTMSKMNFEEMNNDMIFQALQNENEERLFIHDYVIGSPVDPGTLHDDAIVSIPIYSSEFGVLSKGTLSTESITTEEVLQHPLACFGRDDYIRSIEHALGVDKLDNIVIKLSNEEVLIQEVLKGKTLTLVDKYSFKNSTNKNIKLRFTSLEPKRILQIACSYRKNAPLAQYYEECANL